MRFLRYPLNAFLALSLLTVGCARSDGPDREGGWATVTDTLGTGAVRLSHTPPATPTPPSTLQEELRIGSGESAASGGFGSIKGLQVLRDGRIAVLDATAKELRIFDTSGQLMEVFGGEGQGPAEFGEPFGLMQDASGRLWVPDYGNARMSVIDPERGFVETFPLQLLSRGSLWNGILREDGRIVVPSITLGSPRHNVLRVYDASMTQVDSLPLPDTGVRDLRNQPGAFYWEAPGGRGMGFYRIPFFPGGARVLDPAGGIWSTETGDASYRVKYWQPGGDTLLVLEVDRAPLTIPSAERDSAISVVRGQLERLGSADQDYSRVPTVRPSVVSMFLTEDGELWVETPEPEGGTLYDRFDRAGAYLGSVSGGLRVTLRPVVRGRYLWAALTDELEVPYVARFRIGPPAPSK